MARRCHGGLWVLRVLVLVLLLQLLLWVLLLRGLSVLRLLLLRRLWLLMLLLLLRLRWCTGSRPTTTLRRWEWNSHSGNALKVHWFQCYSGWCRQMCSFTFGIVLQQLDESDGYSEFAWIELICSRLIGDGPHGFECINGQS